MGKLNSTKGWVVIMEIVMELVNTGNPNCKDGYIFKSEECGLSTWELEGIAQECFSRFPLPKIAVNPLLLGMGSVNTLGN